MYVNHFCPKTREETPKRSTFVKLLLLIQNGEGSNFTSLLCHFLASYGKRSVIYSLWVFPPHSNPWSSRFALPLLWVPALMCNHQKGPDCRNAEVQKRGRKRVEVLTPSSKCKGPNIPIINCHSFLAQFKSQVLFTVHWCEMQGWLLVKSWSQYNLFMISGFFP